MYICRFLDKIFSPLPLRKLFTFVFPTLVNIASKFALRFGNYAPVLSLTLTSTLFSILLSDYPTGQNSPGFEISCCSLYVSWTGKLLHTRISEHLGISALTSKKQINPPPTSILSHDCDTGHPISPDAFTILSPSFNSIHHLMPTWALFHFLYFKTFHFLTYPLHFSLLFPFVFPTSVLTRISQYTCNIPL